MPDPVSLKDFRSAIANATTQQELAQLEASARRIGAITPTQRGDTALQRQLLAKRQELANG